MPKRTIAKRNLFFAQKMLVFFIIIFASCKPTMMIFPVMELPASSVGASKYIFQTEMKPFHKNFIVTLHGYTIDGNIVRDSFLHPVVTTHFKFLSFNQITSDSIAFGNMELTNNEKSLLPLDYSSHQTLVFTPILDSPNHNLTYKITILGDTSIVMNMDKSVTPMMLAKGPNVVMMPMSASSTPAPTLNPSPPKQPEN